MEFLPTTFVGKEAKNGRALLLVVFQSDGSSTICKVAKTVPSGRTLFITSSAELLNSRELSRAISSSAEWSLIAPRSWLLPSFLLVNSNNPTLSPIWSGNNVITFYIMAQSNYGDELLQTMDQQDSLFLDRGTVVIRVVMPTKVSKWSFELHSF